MRTILLIEDDTWLGELYQEAILQIVNTKVLYAKTAEEALSFLDNNKVDLMVLDVFLPGYSGIELLYEISSYNDINSIPVIMLSAVHPQDFGMNRQRWQQYGVIEYLYKPKTKPADITAVIKEYLTQAG